ncbi:MAG: hypothetical protein AAGD25_02270 [Cyanobacteria bacterium P01_F01_bin.150]
MSANIITPIQVSSSQIEPSLAEKRVSLNVSWQGFQTILGALEGDRSAQLTYYNNGILEIMTPLESHESDSGLIGQFIEITTEELDLTIKTMGSSRLSRNTLGGAEPDQGYYIANEPKVRGRRVDLSVPPLTRFSGRSGHHQYRY